MVRKLAIAIAILLGLAAAYLTLWPLPIDPVAWHPQAPPEMTGPLAENDLLKGAGHLLAGVGEGPEDVAFEASGVLYTGFSDGRIVRYDAITRAHTVFADTGGRPLGMVFDATGRLVVADALRGLIAVAPDGAVTVLADEAAGVPFKFTDDLDIAPDGTVYFTDASSKFGYGQFDRDLFEHGGHGRLLARRPATGVVQVLLTGLQFANGVAVAPDGSYVLVAETGAYRVHKLWLTGPRAGHADIIADNLPGFPDNINRSSRDTYWLAVPGRRNASLDALAPYPFRRRVAARLSPFFRTPEPPRYGLVLELSGDGEIVSSLLDQSGDVACVTSATEHGGQLYLGSAGEPSIRVLPVPPSV